MGIEMGAKNSVFNVDGITRSFLKSMKISPSTYESIYPDEEALYINELYYNLSEIVPLIACPHTVDNVKTVGEIEGLDIQQCLIGTCTNGRLSDLKIAADILNGKKISLVAGVSKDAIDRIKAGDLVNSVASQVGGKGGGRPDMAQAGGDKPENLSAALASVSDWVSGQL